ncbi:DnaJ family domain-containing protein [Bacillus licheniformis]
MGEEFKKRYLHWIDQAVKESEKKDDFKSLPGFGKPLSKEALEGMHFRQLLKTPVICRSG